MPDIPGYTWQKKEYTRLYIEFIIEKIIFDNANSVITDTNSDKSEERLKEGQLRRVIVKTYSYSIPFKGDYSLIQYKPNTFYGIEREADVTGNYHTKENVLKVYFESEINNQAQFDHFKHESIGNLYDNTNENNKIASNKIIFVNCCIIVEL